MVRFNRSLVRIAPDQAVRRHVPCGMIDGDDPEGWATRRRTYQRGSMAGHDIIVLGASAGGVDALRALARDLPGDFPAALFVTLHIPSETPSLLPELLNAAGPLPASHPRPGAPIEPGRIYIAPPDHHLLVERGHLHVVRGPRENGFRPAIDAMFRTAARSYGPRVVGVVLTGMLDDGTAGLLAVKRRGGVAIVQDPAEASYPSMPESALRYVPVDEVLPLAAIAPALVRLATQAAAGLEVAMSDSADLESDISGMGREALQNAERFGSPSPFSCPDCGGVLVEYYDGDLLRFRCQVGHAFSRESMVSSHASLTDRSLWAAFAALDERVNLARRLVGDARRQGDTLGARRFARLAEQAEARKEQVRQALAKEDEAA
jgi:two-component system, chemotaxis family, protein-glutamate methylesterase/glutaminase